MQCTRSESKTLLQKGRVTVNDQICKKGDTKVETCDVVCVDGKPLTYEEFVYLMLNKPKGIISASTDKRDTTVVDLVQKAYPKRKLFPAGRLDKDSTGFVLITDDGGFAHRILAPRRHVSKTYTVTLDAPLTQEMRSGFASGITLADGTILAPAIVSPLDETGLQVQVILQQGVYHQIKRMFGIYGVGVNQLHRNAIGGLSLDQDLAPGQWRELSEEEVEVIVFNSPKSNP
jgi:16S rRNA pseudouridine516 synthase